MQRGAVETKLLRWLVLVPAAIALVLGWRLSQPSVFPDEIGAILNARRLAGLGGASPWWYLPGYGALLIPIVAVTDDPTTLVRGVQLINGALMVVAGVGVIRSLRIFAEAASERNRTVAATLTMLTPAYLYFAGFAVADNALVALAAWLAPATDWMRQTTQKLAIPVGFIGAAAATSVHSRAAILPLALAAGVAVDRRSLDGALRSVSVVLGVVAGRLLAGSVLDTGPGSALAGTGRQSARSLIGDNLNADALVTLPATLLGQLFSITVASFGLVVLGAMYARTLGIHRGARRAPAVALAVAVTAAAASSVLFTNGGTGDFALYARYVEVVLPVVFAFGWLSVLERSLRPSVTLAALVALSGGLLVLLRGAETFDGRIQRLNVAGLAPFVRVGDGLQPMWIGLLGAGSIVIFALLTRVRVSLGVVAVLSVFGFAAIDNVNASRAFVEAAGGPPAISADIDALDYDGCVALDQTELQDFWFQENLRLHRLSSDTQFWPVGAMEAPCGDLVVSSRSSLGDELQGWSPIAVEPGRAQWVWASPKLLDDHSLDSLVTASLGEPLTDPTGSIELIVVSASDQEMVVQLTILNAGDETFVPAANLPEGLGGIQIGLEWRSPDRPDERSMEPIRVALPDLVGPGETVMITTTIQRDQSDVDQLLHAELVQEGIGWIPSTSSSVSVQASR